MTLTTYTNGAEPSTVPVPSANRPPYRRRRLVGTAHRGPHYVNAIRVLRMATLNAVEHVNGKHSANTADQVGMAILDSIRELDAPALHILNVMFSALVRRAQRNK
jgi:hypothetical protein